VLVVEGRSVAVDLFDRYAGVVVDVVGRPVGEQQRDAAGEAPGELERRAAANLRGAQPVAVVGVAGGLGESRYLHRHGRERSGAASAVTELPGLVRAPRPDGV